MHKLSYDIHGFIRESVDSSDAADFFIGFVFLFVVDESGLLLLLLMSVRLCAMLLMTTPIITAGLLPAQ